MKERAPTPIEKLRETARAIRRDASGSVSMEYGLVGTLISVAIIGALSSTTTGLGDKWNSVANTIGSYLR